MKCDWCNSTTGTRYFLGVGTLCEFCRVRWLMSFIGGGECQHSEILYDRDICADCGAEIGGDE